MKEIRVMLVDDHEIVRVGLAAVIAAERDIAVVAEADNGASAVRQAKELRPDVVIMDLMMPDMDGAAATAEIVKCLPGTKVVILTSYSTSDDIAHALDAGAAGALLKTSDVSSLLVAIRQVHAGKKFVSPAIRRLLSQDPPVKPLSPRQREVLDSLTRGLTNADIARQLGLCVNSVERHLKFLFDKLGAANRAEAVAIALRKHLLKI